MLNNAKAIKAAQTINIGKAIQTADIGKVVRTVIMLVISFGMLYPFLWMVSASLSEERQIFNFPFKFIPQPFNFEGYIDVWVRTTLGYPMTVYFFNSLKVTCIGLAGSLISCSLAAYGYTKINFPGRDKIFLLKISTMMIPVQVAMLPNFIIYRTLGLVDKHAALWLATFFGGSFGTFLLRQFFLTIPKELNESAEIDGASNFRIYRQIIMPIAKPALAALFIFNFMSLWNSYEMPLIYLRNPRLYTMPLALKVISSDRDIIKYAGVMAGSVSVGVPVIAVFLAAQKYFIEGIAVAGLKG